MLNDCVSYSLAFFSVADQPESQGTALPLQESVSPLALALGLNTPLSTADGIALTSLREGRYVTCCESGMRHTTFTELIPVFLPGTFRTSVREKNYYIFPPC